MNDFSKKTLTALRRKGISLMGLTTIPGMGDMPFANGERGYVLNDNGTHRILLFTQVMELVG